MQSRTVLKTVSLLVLAACGSDDCLTGTCPVPTAVIVNVTSTISGTRVPGAYLQVNGSSAIEPCNQSDTTVCTIDGVAGTYQIIVTAPGLSTVNTTATFTTTPSSAPCGCESGTPVTLNVTLTPVTSSN